MPSQDTFNSNTSQKQVLELYNKILEIRKGYTTDIVCTALSISIGDELLGVDVPVAKRGILLFGLYSNTRDYIKENSK